MYVCMYCFSFIVFNFGLPQYFYFFFTLFFRLLSTSFDSTSLKKSSCISSFPFDSSRRSSNILRSSTTTHQPTLLLLMDLQSPPASLSHLSGTAQRGARRTWGLLRFQCLLLKEEVEGRQEQLHTPLSLLEQLPLAHIRP